MRLRGHASARLFAALVFVCRARPRRSEMRDRTGTARGPRQTRVHGRWLRRRWLLREHRPRARGLFRPCGGAPRTASRASSNFTEIPGTSGPNWGSLSDPKEIKAKFSWRKLDATEIEDAIRIYGGPLEGEWKLACQGRPPIKVNFPRFTDYPVSGKPYAGRIARMKVPRGLGENLRLRVKESLGDDDKPTIAGRYIRLTWPCGTRLRRAPA